MVLVCAADDRFAMPLAVVLYSALANYDGPRQIVTFVIDGGITERNKRKLRKIVQSFGAELRWLRPLDALLRNLVTFSHLPIAAYYRLLIPDLLPPEITRAIYLDSDLIVEGNLESLWQIDVQDHYLMAAQDLHAPYVSSPLGIQNYRELGLPATAKYFNSGVLLLNLERWRADAISQKVITYVHENAEYILVADQDGLNAVLAGQWGELDPRWNQIPLIYRFDLVPDSPSKSSLEAIRDELINRPYIIHFATPHEKPWMPRCRHPANRRFDRYLKQSGWFNAVEWLWHYSPMHAQRLLYLTGKRLILDPFRKARSTLRSNLERRWS